MSSMFIYLLAFAPLVALPFVFSLWKEFQEEKRVKQMEKLLPNVLDRISLLPPTVSFNNMLAIFSKAQAQALDPLSCEFERCGNKIKRGMPPQLAIEAMGFGNSLILNQAKKMLVQFYKNGLPTATVLREMADQIIALQEIAREAEASTSMQKYSLLLSAAILIPLILALLYTISLQASSLLLFIAKSSSDVQNAVFISVNIYLVVFSLLVSLFIARQSGKAKSFITYFLSTAPLSLLVFHLTALLV